MTQDEAQQSEKTPQEKAGLGKAIALNIFSLQAPDMNEAIKLYDAFKECLDFLTEWNAAPLPPLDTVPPHRFLVRIERNNKYLALLHEVYINGSTLAAEARAQGVTPTSIQTHHMRAIAVMNNLMLGEHDAGLMEGIPVNNLRLLCINLLPVNDDRRAQMENYVAHLSDINQRDHSIDHQMLMDLPVRAELADKLTHGEPKYYTVGSIIGTKEQPPHLTAEEYREVLYAIVHVLTLFNAQRLPIFNDEYILKDPD